MATAACWAVLAVLHAAPAAALFRPALLSRLYGVEAGSDASLLLQHRASLFLAVFAVCAWAAFRPETRRPAVAAVGLSMLSFLALYWSGGSPPALRGIAAADLAGLPFLFFAARRAFRPA